MLYYDKGDDYMAKYSNLDKRMKRYEAASDVVLTRRMPVVLRFDGSHFHTFTKGFAKPFDEIMMRTMQDTMIELCQNIQGAVFGYTQSDEITIVVIDYQTLETDAWFDYRLEKMCSIGASMASRFFNKHFIENVQTVFDEKVANSPTKMLSDTDMAIYNMYTKKFFMADFDCRAFNVPREDVCNCVLWRQKDAEKNSIQALAQSLYTHSELRGISTANLQNKMFTEKGVNWSELSVPKKRGSACRKNNKKWELDLNMPIIQENREYVEKLIML